MDRIATFNNQANMLRNLMKVESTMATAQVQAATELKSTNYAGIAQQSSQLVSLEAHYARTERYVDEGEIVSARIETMHSTVGSMIEVADDVNSLLTSLSGTGTDVADSIQEEAKALLDKFVSLLNTKYEGRSLFAGGATDSDAVSIDTDNLTAPADMTAADTSYYQGDTTIASFRASDELVIDYGLTADDPAIEKTLRAITLIATMETDPIDSDVVTYAADLAQEASDGLTTLQTSLGTAASSLEETMDSHLDLQLTIEAQIEDITKVDLAEAQTRLTQIESLLELTASAITAMKAFNLNDLL